jgi:LacI family transcriptional regulator
MPQRGHGPGAAKCGAPSERTRVARWRVPASGMRVPDDVSIVSFDNDELAAYLRPGLTTIALPHEDMGRRAVDALLSPGDTGELLVPMPVVTRESIATPR